MELSYRFKQAAQRMFEPSGGTNNVRCLETISLEDNNVYRKSLVVDISKDSFEIPMFAKAHCEVALLNEDVNPGQEFPLKKIIIPLYQNAYPVTKRTFDSIFFQMGRVTFSERLCMFITNKGLKYYGGRGMLFDEDMNPIMFCTVKTLRDKEIVNSEERIIYRYVRPICHISPSVFGENSANIMEKGILKKVIPYYSTDHISLYYSQERCKSEVIGMSCKIIVDKMDNFFISPVAPTISSCNNEILNQCAVDNIEDIMQQISL